MDRDVNFATEQEVPFDGILDEPVTLEELEDVINKLPHGKAPSHDWLYKLYHNIGIKGKCLKLIQQ